jgi:hypothetical protein
MVLVWAMHKDWTQIDCFHHLEDWTLQLSVPLYQPYEAENKAEAIKVLGAEFAINSTTYRLRIELIESTTSGRSKIPSRS